MAEVISFHYTSRYTNVNVTVQRLPRSTACTQRTWAIHGRKYGYYATCGPCMSASVAKQATEHARCRHGMVPEARTQAALLDSARAICARAARYTRAAHSLPALPCSLRQARDDLSCSRSQSRTPCVPHTVHEVRVVKSVAHACASSDVTHAHEARSVRATWAREASCHTFSLHAVRLVAPRCRKVQQFCTSPGRPRWPVEAGSSWFDGAR